jgi:hypothetical protein
MMGNVFGQHCGRKRNQRNQHQQRAVDHQKCMIGTPDVPEQFVVIGPHDQHRREAQNVGQVRGPLA